MSSGGLAQDYDCPLLHSDFPSKSKRERAESTERKERERRESKERATERERRESEERVTQREERESEVDGYYSYNQVKSCLISLASSYPSFVSYSSLGLSVEGRYFTYNSLSFSLSLSLSLFLLSVLSILSSLCYISLCFFYHSLQSL
jgi:hypothetical protein